MRNSCHMSGIRIYSLIVRLKIFQRKSLMCHITKALYTRFFIPCSFLIKNSPKFHTVRQLNIGFGMHISWDSIVQFFSPLSLGSYIYCSSEMYFLDTSFWEKDYTKMNLKVSIRIQR